ncbi:hypothetical protein Atoyac10_20 [Aeromonas phage Atoyac10]|nr:hypothetical protein Atoyac10_20 [Aeromonas phage Atoyac10]
MHPNPNEVQLEHRKPGVGEVRCTGCVFYYPAEEGGPANCLTPSTKCVRSAPDVNLVWKEKPNAEA